MTTLHHDQVAEAGLADWRFLQGALHTRFLTGDFATGLDLVNRIGAMAEEMDHHPDLDLRYGNLGVRLLSHDAGGVTGRDVRLARRISHAAAELAVLADTAGLSVTELALDTPDAERVRPFWAAVLDTTDEGEDEVASDTGSMPLLWFQSSDSEEPRQRFHLDLVLPPEQAGPRIEAALAAGGTLVSDADAPSFTVLADADGNRVCICTPLDGED
ncbi:4a-hydroxytetrahydrobiopterin dehydratase [Nocardioides jishulii]|uniref:Putative pterin-4-alpha-carbinolamine dehydratase n=1 Tax=Nocardioides jishulii TaxID=2575440 RepID=A0A4U2YMG5_9ACTN|nr:4a-hydroxytetrahydrobiopterin dehydratase [Nocardioides jishulii]QCX27275.1 4a-hydroxytetrahydrobiopterin dehydratase [Nocardioides jishulii]TKI61762.1 4a-hydroxytetrahydrobiopterin dehydratase [Nocardioides jishulii]